MTNIAGNAHGEPQNKGEVQLHDGKKESEQMDFSVVGRPVALKGGYGVTKIVVGIIFFGISQNASRIARCN